jgi:hypothetical protein
MHLSTLSPVRVLGALLGLVLALAATVAQAHDIIVCKESDSTAPVPAGTSFSFTLDGTSTFALAVGGMCLQFAGVGVGEHVITEAANPDTVVSAITVEPSNRLVSFDLARGTVTAKAVDEPTATTVTFFNFNRRLACQAQCSGGGSDVAHWCQDNYQFCYQNVGQCVSDAAHNGFVSPCCVKLCLQ